MFFPWLRSSSLVCASAGRGIGIRCSSPTFPGSARIDASFLALRPSSNLAFRLKHGFKPSCAMRQPAEASGMLPGGKSNSRGKFLTRMSRDDAAIWDGLGQEKELTDLQVQREEEEHGTGVDVLQTGHSSAINAAPEDAKEESEAILRSILNLAFPALGAVLSDPMMSLIDTGCVGQTGSIQLAALGPNTSIFNFVFQAFGFLGTTTCNIIARIGRSAKTVEEENKQQMEASRMLSYALFLAVVLGLAVLLVMEALAPQLLMIMGTKEEYLAPAISYLRIRALSAPAVLAVIVGQGACMGRQDAKTPFAINFTAAICNLIGDLILTLWARWGVAGAAIATFAAQCIAVCLLIQFLKSSSQGANSVVDDASEEHEALISSAGVSPPLTSSAALPFLVGWYGLPSREALQPFIDMAGPLVVRSALGMTVYTMMAKVAAETGTLEIAAHQVAMQTFWTLSYFPESLSIAAQSLIACDAKAEPRRVSRMARMLVSLAFGLGIALAIFLGSFYALCSSWLSSDAKVRQLMVGVTAQSMLCELLCAVVLVIEGIAIGSGDFAYLPRMQFLNMAGVLSALAVTYRSNWGLNGIWWCLVLYFGTRLIYHSCYIWAKWKNHVLGHAAFGKGHATS